jgi:hypothetical protein
VAEQAFSGSQGRGKRLAGEVDRLPLGNKFENLRLQHIDPGVDGVTEDLAPCGLLQESLDRAVFVGDDDAELEGVLDSLEGQRGQATAGLVELQDGTQIDIGKYIAADHQEPLVQLVFGIPHRAGRPERRRLGGVDHADPELAPVAEVGPNSVGHEGYGHHNVFEPVGPEQVDNVLHHRNVRHR